MRRSIFSLENQLMLYKEFVCLFSQPSVLEMSGCQQFWTLSWRRPERACRIWVTFLVWAITLRIWSIIGSIWCAHFLISILRVATCQWHTYKVTDDLLEILMARVILVATAELAWKKTHFAGRREPDWDTSTWDGVQHRMLDSWKWL